MGRIAQWLVIGRSHTDPYCDTCSQNDAINNMDSRFNCCLHLPARFRMVMRMLPLSSAGPGLLALLLWLLLFSSRTNQPGAGLPPRGRRGAPSPVLPQLNRLCGVCAIATGSFSCLGSSSGQSRCISIVSVPPASSEK